MESPEKAVEILDSVKSNFAKLLKKNQEIITIPTKNGPKDYVRYEGWVTIATVMGIMPRITELNSTSDGYMAKAEAVVIKTGQVVGSAYGICSRKENTWAMRPDFSLAAMAQTRAAARALKMILGGVITHIGYESTPAEILEEEADPGQQEPRPETSLVPASEKQLKCIFALTKKLGMSEEDLKGLLKLEFKKESTKDLSISEASSLIDRLQKTA